MARKQKFTEIYLPAYAQRQLEASDNASIWTRPIPYSPIPTENHPYKLDLTHKSFRDINPLGNDGYFYPDRTEPDSVLELLEEIAKKELAKNKSKSISDIVKPSTEHLNDVYRRFVSNGDAECWARLHKGEIEIISQFKYAGFGGFGNGPSSFTLNQERSIDKVLEEGAGIFVNKQEVNLCNDGAPDFNGASYIKLDNGYLNFDGNERESLNGKTYKLFYDHDGGARGWAIFVEKQKKRMSVMYSDHVSNVRDIMIDIDDFVKGLGLNIDFKALERYNHDFYSTPYVPTMEDFKKAFHINEKGKKRKA
ncbi:MAG TPA: hypothetical protein VEC16_06470 [Alphaproteobacteria bacterium]|nr:hypothetical protein [Alphaproteobacteria bacterium]